MRRLLVVAVVLTLGNASVASAGETLLASATRIVRDLAETPLPHTASAARPALLAQREQPGLASSGIRRRTKVVIAIAIAAAFAGVAHTIDSRVENTTPSTLGTRQDK